MDVTIYHNPRCSKSRQALELLRAKGVEPMIVEYLKTPPNVTELDRILKRLGLEPRELMRRKEAAYAAAGLDDPSLSREASIQAMIDHPVLIERPIVLSGEQAVLGRPPEKVLDLL